MITPMGNDKRLERIDAATERLAAERPFLEPILRPCAAILKETARQVDMLVAARPPLNQNLALDPSRLCQGVSLLTGVDMHLLQDDLSSGFAAMAGVLARAFPGLSSALQPILESQLALKLDLALLSAALIEGDTAVFDETARGLGIDAAVLTLAVRCGLAPVLESVARTSAPLLGDLAWDKGTCPVCGSLPSVSFLSAAEDLGSEFLTGGGGRRLLHCSLCGHQWRIPRTHCPACANADHNRHMVYKDEGSPGERLDVCLNCRGYLPCLDLRETGDTSVPPELAAIAMVHLDAWAAEKGFHPLAATLWNQIQ
jgi:FdhE protein